jgi:predicted deacylase
LAAVGWCASYYRDWILFYVQRDKIVRDLDAFTSALRQTRLPIEAAGSIPDGDKTIPLWVIRKPALHPDRKTICLMGSIHGNEPAGAQALLELGQNMARWPERYANLNYVMVPLANPWGWRHNLRRNAANQDIAREFVDGQSPESTVIKKVLAQAHCDLLVDLHEDRVHEGFYLLAYAPANLGAVHAAVTAIETRSGMARAAKPPQGIWHVPESELKSTYLSTASLWARKNGVPWSFIVEVHDGYALQQRTQLLTLAVEELTTLLSVPG